MSRHLLDDIVMMPIQYVSQGAYCSIADAVSVAAFDGVCRLGTPGGHNQVMPSNRAIGDLDFNNVAHSHLSNIAVSQYSQGLAMVWWPQPA